MNPRKPPRWVRSLQQDIERSPVRAAAMTGAAWGGLIALLGVGLFVSFPATPVARAVVASIAPVLYVAAWAALVSTVWRPVWQKLAIATLAKRQARPGARLWLRRTGVWLAHKAAWIASIGCSLLLLQLLPDPTPPDVAAWLATEPPAVPQQDNAYFMHLGMRAPAGENVDGADGAKVAEAAGRRRVAAMRAEFARLGAINESAKDPFPFRDFSKQGLSECQGTGDGNCIARLLAGRRDHEALLRANRDLLERLHRMRRMRYYVEDAPIHYSTFIAPFSDLLNATRLSNLQAVLMMADGRETEGMQSLLDTLAMYRRWASEPSGSLIRNAVLMNRLAAQAVTVAHVLAWKPALAGRWEARLLAALADDALTKASWDRVWDWEFRVAASGLPRSGLDASLADFLRLFVMAEASSPGAPAAVSDFVPLLRPLYLRGATLALVMRSRDLVAAAYRAGPRRFAAAYRPVGQHLESTRQQMGEGAGALVNLFGRALWLAGSSADDHFYPKFQQAIAVLRAVSLQVKVLAARRSAAAVDEALQDARYAHPISGQLPSFDRMAGALTVAPAADNLKATVLPLRY